MKNEKTTIQNIIDELTNINIKIKKVNNDIFRYDDNIINDSDCWDMNDELIKAYRHILTALKTLGEIQGGKLK